MATLRTAMLLEPAGTDLLPNWESLVPHTPPFPAHDLRLLITDYFRWLKDDWQLPIYHPAAETSHMLAPLPRLLPDQLYLTEELVDLWGDPAHDLLTRCSKLHIAPARREGKFKRYRGRDLLPLWEQLDWRRTWEFAKIQWDPFLPEPCGTCHSCRQGHHPIWCFRQTRFRHYRHSLYRLLQALRTYGSISVWWEQERPALLNRMRRSAMAQSRLLLVYLLDRRLLSIPYQDLIEMMPFNDIGYTDLPRLWQRRRPAEWAAFQRGLTRVGLAPSSHKEVLIILVVLVLLRHGLPGVTELRRVLSAETVTQVIQEGRLITTHIGYGVMLDHPLHDDIRLGHVLIDEIRMAHWAFADAQTVATGKASWSARARSWAMSHINAVERILCAPVWDDGTTALLPLRPETDHALANPFCVRRANQQAQRAFEQLPLDLQQVLRTVMNYRHQQYRIALSVLNCEFHSILRLLFWAQEHGDLATYPHWNRTIFRHLLQRCLPEFRTHMGERALYRCLSQIQTLCMTMAELELPYPSGYRVIAAELQRIDHDWGERFMPPEMVMDRLFRDGICALDYDPFARLALTIQYFCGTRTRETLDLHLYCILEPQQPGQAYLLVPLGKTKRERLFPIVDVGMGKLIEHYEAVMQVQLNPDKTPRMRPRTNYRYLDRDPDKAMEWYYLFDRRTLDPRPNAQQRVMSTARVQQAMHEALIWAALHDPTDLFDPETYEPRCRNQCHAGQRCPFFSTQDGILACPLCHRPLSGKRGVYCRRRLDHDVACTGVATNGAWFCPSCAAPLADFIAVTPHSFRHNSVSRAHRHGMSLAHNMLIHGHQTIPMHLHYLHHTEEATMQAVRDVMGGFLLREIRIQDAAPGQIIEDGVAHTATLEQLLSVTLRRSLSRGTYGMWGAFWMARLGEQGPQSPVGSQSELVVIEETYEHMVAQYRYEALASAVSEVALERGTKGKFHAQMAPFLQRDRVEELVQQYLPHVQDYVRSPLGVRLMEGEVERQRLLLRDLAERLRPWWQHPPLGTIERLVTTLLPALDGGFSRPEEDDHAPA